MSAATAESNSNVQDIPLKSMASPVLFFVAILLGLSALLISWRIESVVVDLKTAREWMQIKGVTDDINDSFQVGLSIYDMKALPAQLENLRKKTPDLIGVVIVDEQGEIIAGANHGAVMPQINKIWSAQLFGKRGAPLERSKHRLREGALLGKSITDPSGLVVAVMWGLYSEKSVSEVSHTMLGMLLMPTTIAGIFLLLFGVYGVFKLVRLSESRLAHWLSTVENGTPVEQMARLLVEKKL